MELRVEPNYVSFDSRPRPAAELHVCCLRCSMHVIVKTVTEVHCHTEVSQVLHYGNPGM